jgi:hypothetical protein
MKNKGEEREVHIKVNHSICKSPTTPYSFSFVAYVWVCGAKTTVPIAKKLFFLKV